jgi:hypothetical protein
MAVNFATPIAHQTAADYSRFNNAIAVGRPFRQPLVTAPNPNNFAPGLELFLSANDDIADIFAWLDGFVSWQPAAAAGSAAALILETAPDVLEVAGPATTLASLRTLEARPKKVIYENADEAAVRTALESLLTTSFAAASANPRNPAGWHPCMRMPVGGGAGPPPTMFDHITAHPPTADTIIDLVNGFFGGAGAVLPRLIVRAGDRIGRAAPYLAADTLPAAPPFPLGAAGDANRARRLTFQTVDLGKQFLNPVYYLHVYMNRMLLPAANRIVTSLTNIVDAGALRHPLATLFPTISAAVPPDAREQVGGAHVFPIGELNNFHAYPADAPVSTLQWRYDNNLRFEAQARVAGTPVPALATTPAATNKVNTLWNGVGGVGGHAAAINGICAGLQVPIELIAALVGSEAPPDLNPRAVRLEPLLERNRTEAHTAGLAANLETEYDHVIGVQGNATLVTHNANDTSRVDVTLVANNTWAANVLRGKRLLVADVDRLPIVQNNAGATTMNYQITVKDLLMRGGASAGGTQNSATTLHYSPVRRGVGQAAPAGVQHAVPRAGTLRRMRVTSTANTLDGETVLTILVNGAPSTLTVTLPAGIRNGNDNAHTMALNSGDNVAIRVETAGATGNIRNLQVTLQFAPGTGDVWVLKEGFTVPGGVPNPWNGAGLVRAGRALTWDQLITVVNATGGARISPGILQTLISTARASVQFVNSVAPTLIAALGFPATPGNAGGFLNDWLLTAAHSLLLGVAYIRKAYNTHSTAYDLPLVGAAYNAGSPQSAAASRWGLVYYGEYVEHAAPHYDAAVTLFSALPAPVPGPNVRFMR